MSTTITKTEPGPRKQLRLWPGVVAAALLCVVRFIVPIFIPEAIMFAMIGGLIGVLAIIVWWLFFSRAPWYERVGAIVLIAVGMFATRPLLDRSIATGGMGMLFYIYAVPVLTLSLVAGAAIGGHLSDGLRRVSIIGCILLACAAFTLLRTGGVTATGASDLHWRWSQTPEQRLLAQGNDEPATSQPAIAATNTTAPAPAPAASASPNNVLIAKASDVTMPVASTPAAAKRDAEWPGFRGPNRDGVVHGVRIKTDWSSSPPVSLWHRPIGPGWSSFAVQGDLLYTQEQRGEDEIVACYKVSTGQPVWRHRDGVRFWESNAGAGPRATPTLSNGRVYTFGATGILNALDASNGNVVWTRNVATDSSTKVPMWGFASSPLVQDDIVVVAAAGKLVAYDLATGKPRWSGPAHGGGYSSPQRLTIGGVTQILLLSGDGATSVAPADGKVLWEHSWPGGAIVQPAQTADGDVVINSIAMSGGLGTRRLAVSQGPGGWTVTERWTSTGLKPYFNDFVVNKGYAFGFDGNILSCIDLKDGQRKWKGGRYGNGQLVLLPDQDLMLVLSEEGELALVSAAPDEFKEIARFPAIEGKTWNHPVLVGDTLLVRNGEQMAAFRLPLEGR